MATLDITVKNILTEAGYTARISRKYRSVSAHHPRDGFAAASFYHSSRGLYMTLSSLTIPAGFYLARKIAKAAGLRLYVLKPLSSMFILCTTEVNAPNVRKVTL